MKSEILWIFISMLMTTLMCLSCFYFGAKVGQKVINKEELKIPNINPIKAVKEYKENRKIEDELDKMQIMSDNIDNYDGTGLGQKSLHR